MLRKLEAKVLSIQADFPLQLHEKVSTIQATLDELRSDYTKDLLESQQKLEQLGFETADKLRDLQTKTTWKLNEFKSKLEEKVNEEYLLMLLEESHKRQ